MSSYLATHLQVIIDRHVLAVRRLCGPDTWTGPAAQHLDEEVRRLQRRLGDLVEEIRLTQQ